MLQYVYEQHEAVAHFVAQLIPHDRGGRGYGRCKAIGVLDEAGNAIAGIVYFNYNADAGTIEIAGAALPKSRWLTRETIRRMYEYPFLQLGVQMIIQRTPADNESLLRQLAAYDYMFITVPRMFGRDRDGVLCLLTREAWEGNRFNRRFKHHLVNAELAKEAA
jgi:RimJ/RimL family protein N-acetyltransferase